MSNCISDNILLGRCLAQLVERASHVQRLCPCCSSPGFESRPGASCCVSIPPPKKQKKDSILLQICLKWPTCSNSQPLLSYVSKRSLTLFYLLDRVSVWTGQSARRLPARHAAGSGALHFVGELHQQKRAQTSPVDTPFFFHSVDVQEQASVLLSDDHTVEQQAVFLLGTTANRWPSHMNELSSGQGARFTRGVLYWD